MLEMIDKMFEFVKFCNVDAIVHKLCICNGIIVFLEIELKQLFSEPNTLNLRS